MKSRTENIARNVVFSTIAQIVSFLVGFVSRTIFIHLLGAEYLGINSLFTNILTILSFAEMGIGTAIVYSMYKPLATHDNKKLNQLIYFYKKTYFLIGTIILVIGLSLIPWLNFLIKDTPNISENLVLIYIFFIINTTISYFFAYRTTIISADQKNYIVVVSAKLFHILQVVLQIILLLLTKNYYLYLAIQILCTLLNNLYLAYKSKKMYPELVKQTKEELPKEEKQKIFSNVKTLFVYKLASICLGGIDSLVLSRYIGIIIVGIYSNYAMILAAITEILGVVTQSMTASIGNLNSIGSEEEKEKAYYNIFYFTFIIYGICSVLLMVLFNDFVNIWLGPDYLLPLATIAALIGHFYVNGVQYASFSYRNTLGLFKQGVVAPILAMILNVTLSILFAKYIGITGVFIATIISRFFTYGIVDPIIVFKNEFKKSTFEYYLKYFMYVLIVLIVYLVVRNISSFIIASNIIMLILKGIVCLILTVVLFILLTFKTREFQFIKKVCLNIFNKVRKRA